MRHTWTMRIALPVVCATLAGCWGGSGDGANDDRRANDPASSSQTISLTGCVETAPGSATEFALRNVRLAPLAEQPSDAPTITSNNAIREGSWVRLTMGDPEQLRAHVGQKVSVVGVMRDDGRSTIGTSGTQPAPQETQPAPDASRAAADEHHSEKVRKEAGPMGQDSMANGTAPRLTVQRVNGTGQPCDSPRPEDRR